MLKLNRIWCKSHDSVSTLEKCHKNLSDTWNKVFKNGPSKICGRQTLKNFAWSVLEYLFLDKVAFWHRCVMIAIGYENQDANLCCSVNRKPIRFDFRTAMRRIQYSVNMISAGSYIFASHGFIGSFVSLYFLLWRCCDI